MADSKIEIKIGEFSFSGEGEKEWLSEQLDKILGKAEQIVSLTKDMTQTSRSKANAANANQQTEANLTTSQFAGNAGAAKPLPVFLKEKNVLSNQNKTFLATACWLQDNGKDSITTSDVTKALTEAKQGKLTNPAHCLNQNVKGGLCVKQGKSFYVTQNGKTSIG